MLGTRADGRAAICDHRCHLWREADQLDGRSVAAVKQLRGGLPFLEMMLVGQEDFAHFVNVTFGTDRMGIPKGMIEVIL